MYKGDKKMYGNKYEKMQDKTMENLKKVDKLSLKKPSLTKLKYVPLK